MGLRGRNNLINEAFFFVTTTIVNHYPLFSDFRYCDILVNNIRFYQNKYRFDILAYVIMPTHFHWIVKTNIKFGSISDIMRDIKKYSAKQILEQLSKDNNNNLLSYFEKQAADIKGQDHKIWEKRFDDQVIRNEKMLWIKLRYIHNNPVKAGLVSKPENYKYCSAVNYLQNDHSILLVDTDYAGIEMV